LEAKTGPTSCGHHCSGTGIYLYIRFAQDELDQVL